MEQGGGWRGGPDGPGDVGPGAEKCGPANHGVAAGQRDVPYKVPGSLQASSLPHQVITLDTKTAENPRFH